MTSGRTECAIAVLAVLCVLGIFFFPALQGPYSVVHGPVTALLSIRAAAGLRMAIVRAGLNPVSSFLGWARIASILLSLPFFLSLSLSLFWTAVSSAELRADSLASGSSLNLRC
jgi:hypothetical protein